jgi:hypothetical protein
MADNMQLLTSEFIGPSTCSSSKIHPSTPWQQLETARPCYSTRLTDRSVTLTSSVLGYIPGIIHALYIILKY